MLTVKKAKEKLFKSIAALDIIYIKVLESSGYILARNIYSPLDIPNFDNSAMDGYALRYYDTKGYRHLKITGEVRAGEKPKIKVSEGTAVRINTGAMIPEGTDSILIKEEASERNGRLNITGTLTRGENIRKKGSEILRGDLVFKARTLITSRVIACLSSMGLSQVPVYRKPKVSVIVTGSELVIPGRKLKPGKLYDSNAGSLVSLLKDTGIKACNAVTVKDDETALKSAFLRAVKTGDVIIFSGGISAGNYDFIRKILKELKVKQIFYKVAQKPGKPLFAGIFSPDLSVPVATGIKLSRTPKKKLIFGLPGNPAASLICYYEYVYPVLRKLQGYRDADIELRHIEAPLLNTANLPNRSASFLKGKLDNGGVSILDGQESHKLASLAKADCLVYVPERKRRLAEGMFVEVHLLS